MSSYNQYLKIGGACSLTDYISIRNDKRIPKFSLGHFNFHRLISYYQTKFSKEHVLVLPYEFLRTDPSLFMMRLGDFVGVSIPRDLPFDVRYNKSVNRFVTSKTRLFSPFLTRNSVNGFSPLAPLDLGRVSWRIKQRLGAFVPRTVEESFALKQRRIVEELTKNYYGESNRITSDLTGLNLSELGYDVGANENHNS